MTNQTYKCAVQIAYPMVVCGYANKNQVCALQPGTPCEFKYRVGNVKPEKTNGN
jgi:hypothetical protein